MSQATQSGGNEKTQFYHYTKKKKCREDMDYSQWRGGAAGAPLFQQRNSPYPRLTLSTHRSTNLDLHACDQKKKIPMPMAHASKCSLSKNLVCPSMERGLLFSDSP